MAKLRKSARGKHRWIGFQLVSPHNSRAKCEDFFSVFLDDGNWRLFDFKIIDGVNYGILKVPLYFYEETKHLINQQIESKTITSSGKIKLVRERMNLK